MADLTDQILAEITPDPHFYPLYPTVGKLEDYAHNIKSEHEAHMHEGWTHNEQWVNYEDYQEHPLEIYDNDLSCEGNHITYEWATNEILGHQMNWVRVGLVAERMRRYRIYKDKFPTWNKYCEEALGFASKKKRITLPTALRDRLEKAADHDGVTIEEKITQLLDSELPEETEEPKPKEPEPEEQLWHQEMKEMVREHDHQIWFLTAISKMVQPLREKVSRYSWLRELQLQT